MPFDFPLFAHELKRYAIVPRPNRLLDTKALAEYHWKLTEHNLAALCNYLSIKNERAHRALPDTKACAKVFEKLLEKESNFDTLWRTCLGYTLRTVSEIPLNSPLLQQSLQQGKDLCISYQGAQDKMPRERWIKPLGIVPSFKGHPSMWATCFEENKDKSFRLDRVKQFVRVR